MSLLGTLNVGKSALAVHQAAIQVTGNNIANAGNADFTRQTASISPARDQQVQPGIFLGTGVNLNAVRRQIDEALEGRLRASVSDSESAGAAEQWLGRVESAFNELGDDDLSTRLSTFFGSWSGLANKPQDTGLRQAVLQNGQGVATWLNDLRSKFAGLQSDVDARLGTQVKDADGLAQQVADLNGRIVVAEGGGAGQSNGLRDQRDAVLKQLPHLVEVRTVQQENGVANVYIGSEPLVFGSDNRGLALKQDTVDGRLTARIVFRASGGPTPLASGQLGGLLDARGRIGSAADQVDSLAKHLIFEMNKLHASGQGVEGFGALTASNAAANPAAALNDPAAGLPFTPANGSFVSHVRHKPSGLVTSTLVQVDLDGLNGDDTTLDSLAADLEAVPGVNASVVAGKLKILSDSDALEFSFSQDSSGALAVLGVNAFFTGADARSIAVNSALTDRPALLAAARNGQPGDNQTAMTIAALESQPLAALGGSSLKQTYQSMVNGVANDALAAKTEVEATRVVQETLQSQREALSGVSLDEEAVNLMRTQRAFQGAARLISAVDELMQTVLNLV